LRVLVCDCTFCGSGFQPPEFDGNTGRVAGRMASGSGTSILFYRVRRRVLHVCIISCLLDRHGSFFGFLLFSKFVLGVDRSCNAIFFSVLESLWQK